MPQETAFRRRSLELVGGLDEDLHYTLDWDLFLRFQDAGARIVHVTRLLGAFRWHSDQKTADGAAGDALRNEIALVRRRNNNGLELSDAEAAARSDFYKLRSVPYRPATGSSGGSRCRGRPCACRLSDALRPRITAGRSPPRSCRLQPFVPGPRVEYEQGETQGQLQP